MIRKSVLGILGFSLFLLLFKTTVSADWILKKGSGLIFTAPSILGEKDDEQENKESEQDKHEQKNERDEPKEIKNQIRENNIEEIKISTPKDKEDKLKIEIKEKNREKVEDEQEEFEIEGKEEDEDIKISTGEAQGEMEIHTGSIEAKLHFPLSVDPVTHALIVTTPAGTKAVTILPDHAASVISRLGLIDNATAEAKLEIKTENNQLVYEVEGNKIKKLFGLITIPLPQQIILSAESGNVIKVNESFILKLINFFSI